MSKVSFKLSLSLMISTLFLAAPAFAAPTIKTIAIQDASNLADGQSIIIRGSGFGAKSPAAPRVWTNFDSGSINPSSLGTASAWTRTDGCSISSQNQETNSTYNVRGVVNTGSGSSPNVALIINYADAADSQGFTKTYTFVRRYYDDANWWNAMSGQFHNYKFYRLWTNPVGTTSVWPDSYFIFGQTDPVLRFVTEGTNCKAADDTDWGAGTTLPPVQQWLREEYAVSRANGTGVAKMWSNGTLVKNLSNLYTASGLCDPSPYTDSWISLSIENFWTLVAPPVNSYVYFDDVYIDNTWARVMAGDQNTFDSSAHREIQIPSAWSDTEITITLNQGSFASLNNTYIYVVDANGNASNGFRLCTTCFRPPANFQTQ